MGRVGGVMMAGANFSVPLRKSAPAICCLLIAAASVPAALAGSRGDHNHSSGPSGGEDNRATLPQSQPAAAAPFSSLGQSGDGRQSGQIGQEGQASPSSASSGANSPVPGNAFSGDDNRKAVSTDTGGGGDGGNQDSPRAATPGTVKANVADPSGRDPNYRSASGVPPASGPPRTVEEWLKQLIAPATPAPGAPKPDNGSTAAAQPARPKRGAPAGTAPAFASEAIAPEILAPRLSPQGLQKALALGFKANGKVGLSGASGGISRLLAPPGLSAEAARDLLREALPGQDFGVNQVYRIYRTAAEPADARPPVPMATPCGTDRCFGSNLVGWRPQLQACARKVRIGVIDTAFDASHPTFRQRQIEVRQKAAMRNQASQPAAPNWHGTGVLAMLVGEPRSGTPGLIPEGRFLAADVFFADANGLPVSDTANLIEALNWLELRHADIINMSLTGPHDDLLKEKIERMSDKGVLFVAAVGNDGPAAAATYPSAYPQVLAVTAINKDLSSYRYANRGDHVDVSAPGVDIWTALPGGLGTYHSGTSFAVPYATAIVAALYPSLAVKTKVELIKHMNFVDLGPPGKDPIYGHGLVIAPYACAAPVKPPGGEVPKMLVSSDAKP